MASTHLRITLVLATLALVAGGPAIAKPTPAQKCTSAKLKAAAKKATVKLACHARAASKRRRVDGDCLGRAEAAFVKAFGTAESKGGCLTTADAAVVEAAIEGFVQAAVTALPGGDTKESGKCAGAKRKAAGQKVSAKLLCHAKATTKGVPVNGQCLGKAETAFAKAFGRAERKGGCATVGDAATLEQAVDGLVAQVVSQLTSSTTTTTPTTPGSTTTTLTTPGSTTTTPTTPGSSTTTPTMPGSTTTTPTMPGSTTTTPTMPGSTTTTTTTMPGPVSFAASVQPIFSARCALPGCHTSSFPAGGMILTAGQAYGNIVNVMSSEVMLMRVLPGDTANSYLYRKITNAPGIVGAPMPFGSFPLPAQQITTIGDWITQGALDN